jgi:hypothetical protein
MTEDDDTIKLRGYFGLSVWYSGARSQEPGVLICSSNFEDFVLVKAGD